MALRAFGNVHLWLWYFLQNLQSRRLQCRRLCRIADRTWRNVTSAGVFLSGSHYQIPKATESNALQLLERGWQKSPLKSNQRTWSVREGTTAPEATAGALRDACSVIRSHFAVGKREEWKTRKPHQTDSMDARPRTEQSNYSTSFSLPSSSQLNSKPESSMWSGSSSLMKDISIENLFFSPRAHPDATSSTKDLLALCWQ